MLLRILAAVSLTLSLLFAGCASQQGMAKLDDSATIAKSGKCVYLLTVTLRNNNVPSYQPKLQAVRLIKITGQDTYKTYNFEADLAGRSESDTASIGSSYLIRMEIEPGDYIIMGLDSWGQSLLMTGTFFTPIGAALRVSVNTPGLRYLGHIEATVKPRKGDEFRAGPYLPRQEQLLTGASTGTFDVALTDQWETDSEKFITKFPTLKGVAVTKAALPAFNPERIQRWWDRNAFNDRP